VIRSAVSTSSGTTSRVSCPMLDRPADVDVASAATTRPDRSRTGAEADSRPTSSSSLTTA
jgi:hypothetical protein